VGYGRGRHLTEPRDAQCPQEAHSLHRRHDSNNIDKILDTQVHLTLRQCDLDHRFYL